MSDINELIQAIGLAEKLASGVAREADRFPTENVTRIREALASARIRAEEVGISADLVCDANEAEDRLKRAVDGIAASEREGRPAAVPFIVSDEAGDPDYGSPGKVPFSLRLDVLRAREALSIAELRNETDLGNLRETLALAKASLVEATLSAGSAA